MSTTSTNQGPEVGDLTFYAEPVDVGRFLVGMGEVVGGDEQPRVCIGGPLVDGGKNSAFYLTQGEARELGEFLTAITSDGGAA